MSELCSMRSREVGEPIAGSAAAETAVWIVLEHRASWGAKAVAESNLPDEVKARLTAWEAEIPGARVQLARRQGRVDGPLRLWIGVSDLGASRLCERTIGSPEELLQLDVPAQVRALRAGEAVAGAATPAQPLVLVCTNGRRDVCCAKLGAPVAQALAQQDGLEVWQTTHLGGHRFAATLLQLPEGLCYGRLEPHEAPALAEAIRGGKRIHGDRTFGRAIEAGRMFRRGAVAIVRRHRLGRRGRRSERAEAVQRAGGGDHLDGAFAGDAGGDSIVAGSTFDALSYSNDSVGVTVNLATGTASGGDATGDTLVGSFAAQLARSSAARAR